MSAVGERARENVTGILSLLVLGTGFLALFAGFRYFFVVWIVGYAVLVPLVAILAGEADTGDGERWQPGTWSRDDGQHREDDTDDEREVDTTDALATLRERYARGELTDAQFERKLDALLETESPESAAEWRTREHGSASERGRRPERERS
jgi:hypothetical protein